MENTSSPQNVERKHPNLAWLLALLGAAVLGLVVFGSYQLGRRGAAPSTPVASPTATPSLAVTTTPTPKPTSTTAVTDEGVTWLDTQQKLKTDLKLFKNLTKYFDATNASEVPVIEYYKVGTDSGNDIVLAVIPAQGPGGDTQLMFVKKDSTHYDFLTKHSPSAFYPANKYVGPDLVDTVTTNTTKIYKSITVQPTLNVNGYILTVKPGHTAGGFFDSLTGVDGGTAKEYATTPYGKVYVYTQESSTGLGLQSYILRQPDNLYESYLYVPRFVTDDNVPQVTWNDGTKNHDAYRYDGSNSCGSVNYVSVLKSGDVGELKSTGKATTGETVYEFKDKNNPVVQDYYKMMGGQYYDSTTNQSVSITVEDFLARHGMFTYKTPLDQIIVFTSLVYGIQAECGKPVVYLYPTQPTNVSVQVEAAITKSEPAYGTGWNVLAQPNGDLTTRDGAHYDSLYWEGTGKDYPPITSGFVVKQADVKATLENQLTQLGLNSKEKADFLAFWLPKMPTTPYVRLTWFGTQQVNQLAPLHITPAPDSVIRIFLDFQGLNQPINLPSQRLNTFPRKGFTVVEWGGLLRK